MIVEGAVDFSVFVLRHTIVRFLAHGSNHSFEKWIPLKIQLDMAVDSRSAIVRGDRKIGPVRHSHRSAPVSVPVHFARLVLVLCSTTPIN